MHEFLQSLGATVVSSDDRQIDLILGRINAYATLLLQVHGLVEALGQSVAEGSTSVAGYNDAARTIVERVALAGDDLRVGAQL